MTRTPNFDPIVGRENLPPRGVIWGKTDSLGPITRFTWACPSPFPAYLAVGRQNY